MKTALRTVLAAAAVCAAFAAAPAEARQYNETSTYSETTTRAPINNHFGRSDIATIQTQLAERGFYKGTVDGSWGPMSAKAVRDFQESRDLPPDGRLTDATLAELDLAANDGSNSALDAEPSAGGAYTETTVTSEVYTTRGKRGFSAAEFDAQNSTCMECTDGIYGNGGKPDAF